MPTIESPTMTDSLVQVAQDMAAVYHEGQVDKAGLPYFFHVLRVSASGATTQEQVLGAIHDLLEDTNVRPLLIQSIFGDDIARALAVITREPGESYRAYIDRVAKNPLARAVKITDLKDNIGRLGTLPLDEADRLYKRYHEALTILGGW